MFLFLIAVWQQPYVNVFKHFQVHTWKKSSKEGDVDAVMVWDMLQFSSVLHYVVLILQFSVKSGNREAGRYNRSWVMRLCFIYSRRKANQPANLYFKALSHHVDVSDSLHFIQNSIADCFMWIMFLFV